MAALKGQRLHSSFPPPPPHRPSLGGSAGRNAPRETAAAVVAEETLNLVSGNNPPAFSMIIRLAPDLVEQIKRVEAQGGRVRMKFDSNPYNSGGNIIDVGGKQFRFTWSQEFGDLCDIYEEHQSGEDGNGLLVESGCAWRKLNVQRILDESTKNHVKMRSEEAERKLKSRKAIVLEPGNPSMRSQIKALATVEATQRKNYNKKNKVALKKRKVETLQVGGPPKSTYKPGSTSTTATKGRHSSLLSSPPDQSAASSSLLGAVNISKSIDEAVPSQMIGMQDTNAGSKKEIPSRINNAMRNTPRGKGNNIAEPIDLQSMLISLLMNKPNGLTLKALEKAVQDIVPNPIKKIEPIVRKIAKYKSPGRYILLPGLDLESFKKPQTKSGSSPDDNQRQLPAHQEFHYHTPAPWGGFKEKFSNDDLEEPVQLNSKVEEESNTLEKINVQHASPDIFSEKKGSDHSEGQGGSFSDSGSDSDSDSDSDSSDSGSDSGSHSRSRSRSPAGTGSGSSSDSENDASSNSKESSDEDVDIMTRDDEKGSKYKIEASYEKVSSFIPVKSPDGSSLQYEIHEKQDDRSNGSKQSLSMVSHCLKQGEMIGKLKEGRQGKYLHIGTSPKDNNRINLDKSPVINGRGFSLQRELSNLGLGELRESTPDETHVTKQFEIKNSFGHLENKANASEEGNPNVVKPSVKATLESRKPSPAFVSSGFPSNLESTNKKNSDDHFEDSTRSHARVMQSHPQHLKAVNVEIGSQNKLAEMNGGFRSNESGVSQAIDLEGCSESSRRAPANAFKQHDTKRGTVPYPVKESKRQTPNSLEEVADRGKDSGFADKNNSDQKRRESSSDEDSCPYSKYEKDEPELKGPIMTLSQYKEYVQEFREKYDCYSYLQKILKSYREEFYEIGKDLKYFKDRDVDRYNNILGQLKESYLRYGLEHKRQKKIHVVLHLELEQLKRMIEDFVHSYNKKKNTQN